MINPNKYKRVRVQVIENGAKAIFNGKVYDIYYRSGEKRKKEGNRYLYLNYSIMAEDYLLWSTY